MDDCLGGVGRPDGHSFVRVEGHGEDFFLFGPFLPMNHCVPDELAGAGPSEVAHVFSFEIPGFRSVGLFVFVFQGFFWSDEVYGFIRFARFVQAIALLAAQYGRRIL